MVKEKKAPLPKSVPHRLAYKYPEARFLLGGISDEKLRRLMAEDKLHPIEHSEMIAHAELERFLKACTKRRDSRKGRRAS